MTSTSKPHPAAAAYASWVMRNRLLVLLLVSVATIFCALQIPGLDLRNDPDLLLPASNRYVATNAYGQQKFGMGNLVVIGFILKQPGDIYQPWLINLVLDVHKRLIALDHANAENFMDIASQKIKYMGSSEGSLVFRRLLPANGIGQDPQIAARQLAHLKQGLESNPVSSPMLLYSEDAAGRRCSEFRQPGCSARGTFIIGDFEDSLKLDYLPWIHQVIAITDEIKAQYGDRIEVLIAGEPWFLAYMLYDLGQKWWLFAVSVLIVIGILWWQNKGWRGAAYPMLGVSATIIMTLGVMGFSDFKLTTMMVLTPMLLLAIGTGHAVQVTRRFLTEMLNNDCDARAASWEAITHTMVPATLAIITDMVGFAALAFVDISFYQAYAWFGMFGMATLLITTTTLIPILMSFNPPKVRLPRDHALCEPSRLDDLASAKIEKLILGPGKWIVLLGVALLLGWSASETRILQGSRQDLMPGVEKGINYARAAFKENSAPIRDLTRLGEVMPGVISVNIPVSSREPLAPVCEAEDFSGNLLPTGCWDEETRGARGIINNAEAVAAMERLENWMRNHPNIEFTASYVQYLRLTNMLLTSPGGSGDDLSLFHVPDAGLIRQRPDIYSDPQDPEYVPDPDFIVQTYNGLLEVNSSPGDLDALVDTDSWNEAVIMGYVNTLDPRLTHKVVVDLQRYLREHAEEPGFSRLKFGFRVGDSVTLPQSGETLTIEGDPAISDPGLGGFLGVTEATREVSYANWLISPLQTALAIFVISALMFRSMSVALILIVMLAITLFAQYGLGAYFSSVQNWSGNLAFHLLVTLSIAMGLGVDYSIYMIERLREEYEASMCDWKQAVYESLRTTGGAVVASVIVLLGSLIPLLCTQLANTWGLGVYIGQALIIDVIIAFTLLPILARWLKPRYVFKPADE